MLQDRLSGTTALSELFLKNPDESIIAELKVCSDRLQNIPESSFRNLPIGEAMLQLHSKAYVF